MHAMNYELNVKHFFESLGYQVEKISEGDEESPDFLIAGDTSTYVLELKTKFPSSEEIEERKRILYSGAIHNVHEVIIRKNRLSGIIKKAKDQLKNYQEENILRIVWLLATGHLAEPRMHQFESTLYGLTTVVSLSSQRTFDCYFFYDSDFYRFREILDGAIISTESEAKLLLNPLSPRYAQLKSSSLTKHLGNAVVDPVELERQTQAFLVVGDIDRNDKEAVLRYLREKYRLEHVINITMNYLSGTIIFPDRPSKG